jgi:prepilin-type N-terminal cleavage/methylation domain-containing protein
MFISPAALPRTRGFTIIELIVGLAIILLLVSMISVAVGGIRQNAILAKSSANIRQSTAGLFLLANDRGGVISIRGGGEGSGPGDSAHWAEMLERNMQFNREVFFSEIAEHGLANGIYTSGLLWAFRVSYGVNFTLEEWDTSREDGQWIVKQLPIVRIDNPSETILMASTMNAAGLGRYALDHLGRGSGGSLHMRYSGRALVSFADGSVRTLGPSELADRGFLGAYGKTSSNWVTFQ